MICSLDAPTLLKHKDEIEMLLGVNNIDILALNGTKIDETISSCHTEIYGYNHERFDRNRHGGGVSIYIKSSINYERLNDFSPSDNEALDTVTVEIKPRCAMSFIVTAWYRPPQKPFYLYRQYRKYV